jgi:hypothetical protein
MSWDAAALIVACSGAFLWGFYSFRMFKQEKYPPRLEYSAVGRKRSGLERVSSGLIKGHLYFLGLTFILARVFIIVEAFLSLRMSPEEMYLTPRWSDFIPHL